MDSCAIRVSEWRDNDGSSDRCIDNDNDDDVNCDHSVDTSLATTCADYVTTAVTCFYPMMFTLSDYSSS